MVKAKVELAAVKGVRTLAELAKQFEVQTSQIQTWKKQLVKIAEEVFEQGRSKKKNQDGQIKELHAKIGELAMGKDFLSKALGRLQEMSAAK